MSMDMFYRDLEEVYNKGFEVSPVDSVSGSFSEFYFKCPEGHSGEAPLEDIAHDPEVCFECSLVRHTKVIDNNIFECAVVNFHTFLLASQGITSIEFENLHVIDYRFDYNFTSKPVSYLESIVNAWGMDLMEFIKRADKYDQKCKEELLND